MRKTKNFSILPIFYSLIFPSPPPNGSLSMFNKRVEVEQKKKKIMFMNRLVNNKAQ